MAESSDKTVFKYVPVYPQAPMDMRYHYYDYNKVLKINDGLFRMIDKIEDLKEYAKTCEGKVIAVDTETTGLTYFKDKIVGFSISTTPFEGIYVPIRHKTRRTDKITEQLKDADGKPLFTRTGKPRNITKEVHHDFESPHNINPKEALDVLYEIMSKAKLSVLHNSEFDLTMIKAEGYDITKLKTFDTIILTHLYDAENKGWNGLKECSKIVLGRYPMKFAEALGTEENFQYVDLAKGFPYAAADSANTLGIFLKLYPLVKQLLAKAPKVLNLGEGRYDVMKRDNELIRAFTDYYCHVPLYVNKNNAIEYKENIENSLAEIENKIYTYFKKGQFNLSTSSKEFKQTMKDFNIDTGLRTEKGAISYGKKGIEQMSKQLRKFKDILSLDWNTQVDYNNGKLNKRTSLTELKLAEIIMAYGKQNLEMVESANLVTIRSIEGIKLTKPEFFQELALIYKTEKGKLEILEAVVARNALMKALNSYVTKLTETDICHMRYRLQGTASGRLSSGNGSKSDKRKNHYFIDLNAQNLTKPHSAYYKAIKTDSPNSILGWDFELVSEEYYHEHKDDEIIVEGSQPKNNIRACFVAPEGRYIASLDYSAQEYRMIALLSGDHKMLDNFRKGIDPHTATAYAIWGEEHYDRQKRKKAKGCVGDDVLLLTNNGYKTAPELNTEKDMLIDMYGQPQHWAKTVEVGPMIEVTFSNGITETYTPKHKLRVWNGKEIEWKMVKDIDETDDIIQFLDNWNYEGKVTDVRDYSDRVIRKNTNKNYSFNICSKEFAYLAGLYLGDGSLLKYGKDKGESYDKPCGASYCVEPDSVDIVKGYFEKVGLDVSTPFLIGKNKKIYCFRTYNVAWAHLINDMLGQTKGKHLSSEFYQLWGKEQFKYFVAGLLDSDGTIRLGYHAFSTTSKEITKAMSVACSILGIKVSVATRTAKYKGEAYPWTEILLWDIPEGLNLPILHSSKRNVNNCGASRVGDWKFSKEYAEELRARYKEFGYNYRSPFYTTLNNVVYGKSRLTTNVRKMMLAHFPEFPIKDNMACLHVVSAKKVQGNINVIQTENHLYSSVCGGSGNCNFLMSYCGGPKTLSENLDIPLEEAVDIIKKYEEVFHECVKWKKNEVSRTLKNQDGCAYSIFGRPRQFKTVVSTASSWQDPIKQKKQFGNVDSKLLTLKGEALEKAVERKIVSHAVQSPCGDICRWDLIQLYRKYFKNRDPHIDFYSTVHDEINYTIDKEYTVDYVRELDDLMTFTALGKGVPIITSIDLGYSLGVLFPFEWEDETRTNLVPSRA